MYVCMYVSSTLTREIETLRRDAFLDNQSKKLLTEFLLNLKRSMRSTDSKGITIKSLSKINSGMSKKQTKSFSSLCVYHT